MISFFFELFFCLEKKESSFILDVLYKLFENNNFEFDLGEPKISFFSFKYGIFIDLFFELREKFCILLLFLLIILFLFFPL